VRTVIRKRKRIFIQIIPQIVMVIIIGFGFISFRTKDGVKKPDDLNVLLVTLDTTRADRIGCYGYEKAKTPNLDFLAASGVMFSNAYCQVPLTLPSHCSILTGTYPLHHQVHNNGFYYLDPSHLTLAEVLRKEGFKTAAFVSSFTLDSRFGLDQGFDVYDDTFDEDEMLKNFRSQRRAERVFASFSDWLEGNFDKRFFCWVHFFDPHVPYDPPSPFKEEFPDRPYDGEIAYMDHYLGRIVDELKEKKILDKTLIILAGDHGEAFGEKGEIDHGYFIYDVTLRIPLILYSPKLLPQGKVVESRVRLIDLMPTVLEMLTIPLGKEIQGVSLLPYVEGKKKESLSSYIETFFPQENYGCSELIGLIKENWKYIQAPKPELYDLEADPQEEKNIFPREKKVASVMIKELERMIQEFSAERETRRKELTSQEREKLRSLGYLDSGLPRGKQGPDLPDPKDKIGEYRLFFQGNVHETRGDFQRAQQYYEELLQLNPHVPYNYVRLAYVLQRMEKTKEAVRLLEQGREGMPDSIIIQAALGFAYLNAGMKEKALGACQQALKLDPNFFDVLFLAGTVKWMEKKWAEALDYFEKAIEIEPENKILQQRYAFCLLGVGKSHDALRIYERLKQEYPKDHKVYLDLAYLYSSTGDLVMARAHIKQATEINPAPETYFYAAFVLERMGDLKEAIHHLKWYLEKTEESDTPRKIRAKKTLREWQNRLKD
jgi:arylsulfatase A-like enzyme/Flp pilus assembly protein TadD